MHTFIQLDPTNLGNDENYALMRELFNTYKMQQAFSKDTTYILDDKGITLTNTILRLPNTESESASYSIVSNKALGAGSFSTAYPIQYNLLVSPQGTFTYNTPNPQTSVKIQSKTLTDAAFNKLKLQVNNEYKHSKNGHLNAQPPIFVHNDAGVDAENIHYNAVEAYLIINLMPGIELFEFINTVILNKVVSINFRLMLTLELLRTFQRQVVLKEKAHLDLKPENIIIDTETSSNKVDITNNLTNKNNTTQCTMNIIDFESCSDLHEPRDIFIRSEVYSAPEIRTQKRDPISGKYPPIDDHRYDMHGVGVSAGLFWNIKQRSLKVLHDDRCRRKFVYNHKIYLPAHEQNSFAIYTFAQACQAIAMMAHPLHDTRWTIDESILFFESLQEKYNRPDSAFEMDKIFRTKTDDGGSTAESTPNNSPEQDVDNQYIHITRQSPVKFIKGQDKLDDVATNKDNKAANTSNAALTPLQNNHRDGCHCKIM